ncbi:MAG: hypothetical protein KF841_08650 [Phycisphaerae bacterium]|nr:hypothetical protein [Phycisphaerae bacterium]
MMHSSPMPLTVALDMTKRLHHELAKHMTPEQQRDMTRIQRLIEEAQHHHQTTLLRYKQEAAAAKPNPPARKSFWGR